jgi:signal transduction histidine kinase
MIQELVEQLHREIRTASYLLHPPMLDENGLAPALSWYVPGLAERSGLEIKLDITKEFGRLAGDMELVVFRLVQECLTNIHRHSGSRTASIGIMRDDDAVTVEVRDQGQGIPPEKLIEMQSSGSGVGIRGMRERLRHFSGKLTLSRAMREPRSWLPFPFRSRHQPGKTLRLSQCGSYSKPTLS